ncbi:MAG: hypothetical protein GX589_09745, partial [Deltaproteobacteria bacterium]|nr:hypothetical protein [Deltaproteobacteria bacterium]
SHTIQATSPIKTTSGSLLPRNDLSDHLNPKLLHPGLHLGQGQILRIYIPKEEWRGVATALATTIKRQHLKIISQLGALPPFSVELVLLDQASFHETTAAPSWAQAVCIKGRIYVPVGQSLNKLQASVRHEYVHALVYAVSGGRASAWIDEGLSLWFEGGQEAAAAQRLRSWLERNPPVRLAEIQRTLVHLPEEKAKAAYAQSLFAVRDLMLTYGPRAFSHYFRRLATVKTPEAAFASAFGLPLSRFEQRLNIRLKKWVSSSR